VSEIKITGQKRLVLVSGRAHPKLAEDIATALGALRDPRDGTPLFASIYRRDELYSGEATELAPDLMLDSWSSGYRVAVKRDPSAEVVGPPTSLAGVREPWSSEHRPTGILVAAGPRVARAGIKDATLYDIAPTMLALLGQPVATGSDGRVLDEALEASFLQRHPVAEREVAARSAAAPYSDEEAAAVAAHLQELGYIE